jgi:hypothetical protein
MNTEEEFFIPNQKTRKKLAEKLKLKFDEGMQDWEYEIADSNRVMEFIEEYDKSLSTKKEKQTLMEMIIDSSNDLLCENRNAEFEKILLLINERLQNAIKLHKGTLNYWKSNNFEISKRLINV